MALCAAVLAAGCGGEEGEGGDPSAAAVTATIRSTAAAVARKDAHAACSHLTARARAALQRRAGTSCEGGVKRLTTRLPGPGFAALERLVVRDVRVKGGRASAIAEPPGDLIELARASGVTRPLSARIRLVRANGGWKIDRASEVAR